MHLCIAVDSNPWYLKQCGVMLFSLLKNNQAHQIILHVIHTPDAKPLFEQQRDMLSNFIGTTHVTLQFYSVDFAVIQQLWLPFYNNLPLTTYFRLLLPKLLDQTITKCIYLDTDMIIRKSIVELYALDLGEDRWVAGVMTNVLKTYMQNIWVERYVNAWVLLINLHARRTHNIASNCIDFIVQYPKGLQWLQPIMGDQCAINYICRDHILTLDPLWNVTPMRYNSDFWVLNFELLWYTDNQIQQAQLDPAILHFAWIRKPCDWISFHPWKFEYYRYLFSSGLVSMQDFLKFAMHILTYPLKSNWRLYQRLRRLRNIAIWG